MGRMAGPHVSVVLPTMGTTGHPGDPEHIVATARAAERLGFDGVWAGDHIRHPRPMMESLVALCFAAAHTQRIAVEWSVLQIAMRRLPVIAKQIATLTCFAPGRVGVGIGVGGEYAEEWKLVGVPRAERGRRTDVAVAQLRSALDGTDATFPGLGAVRLDPVPPMPVPLFFGGRRPAALRRAAAYGDGWIGWLHSASGFGAVREALREQRADLGRSGPFWYGIQVPALFSGPGARAEVTLPRDSGRYVVTGSPDGVVSRLREYWDAGADRFKLSIVDTPPGLDQLELLGREVLPELRSWRR
jgi:alkanesulfonate monooxygenase SsuD/methylene tetrahydromethanopterin reductase-like flavin-dependent oxidoreductase (luciferase family)